MRVLPPSGSWLRLTAVGLLLAISCGGGSCGPGGGSGGCGGCAQEDYEYPRNDPTRPDALVQDDAARVRVTQSFIDFLQPMLPDVIRSSLAGSGGGIRLDANGVLHIPVPDQRRLIDVSVFGIGLVGVDIVEINALMFMDDLRPCVGGNRSRCMLLEFVEGAPASQGVRLSMHDLRIGIRLKVHADVLGSDARCPVVGGEPQDVAARISLSALIQPGVGPDPARLLDVGVQVGQVQLQNLAINVLGSSAYCAEPACRDCAVEVFGACLDPGGPCNECHLLCGGVLDAAASLANALIGVLRPVINNVLTPVVRRFVQDALADINNQPAKAEAQLDIAALAGMEALRRAQPLGLFVAPEPGPFPIRRRGTDPGMEIDLSAGAEGELADCVGDLDPFVATPGPVPELGGTDRRGRPYHIGMTLSSSYLNQVFYALHRSGTLCLKLTSADIRALTDGAFTLNASILSLLASDLSKVAKDRAPVILELKPRHRAVLELGSGEQTGMNSMGNPTYDWLIKLRLQELGVAFHVLVHDRYVRIFEVSADIFVGLNVTVLPDNRLEVAVGELRIDGFRETFNELLPNADFARVLPTLLDLALGGLLNDTLKFDFDITDTLSNALNGAPIYMRVNELFRDGVQQDYLTLSLTFTNMPGANLSLAAETIAELHPTEPGLVERIDGLSRPVGFARLVVGQGLSYTDQRALEYQARVDAGLWRTAQAARPDGTLVVEDPKLLLPGRHTIELRARYADDYQTLDPTPARVVALVDVLAPTLRVRRDPTAEGFAITVSDEETEDASTLRLEARVDEGAWTEVALVPSEDPGEATAFVSFAAFAGERLELRARDASGNLSEIETLRLGLRGAEEEGAPAAGCACHEVPGAPHDHGSWPLALFALAAGLYLARARNRS